MTGLIVKLIFGLGLSLFSLPGDGNEDGTVDGLDYIVWADNFRTDTTNGATDGDYNNDGSVNGLDYLVWTAYYGQSDPDPDPDPTFDYWVSTTGNDSNPGTESSPFRNVQKAADVAQAGQSVFIEEGSYNKWVLPRSGQAGQPIIFVGAGPDLTLIDGRNRTYEGLRASNRHYFTISDMAFRNWEREGIFFQQCTNFLLTNIELQGNGIRRASWDHGLSLESCNNFILTDLLSYENYAMGLYINECEDGLLETCIGNNNTGTSGSDGILLQNSSRITLNECQAHNNREDGLDCGGFETSGHSMDNIIFRNCVAANNGGEGFAISGANGGEFSSHDYLLEDCIATDNRGVGIQLYVYAYDIHCNRCIFDRNERGYNIHTGAHDILIENGSIQNNRNGDGYNGGTNVVIRNNQ